MIVIAVTASGNSGKSSSLLRLIKNLELEVKEHDDDDRLAVGMYHGLKVGVSTQGDPKSCMEKWFSLLADEHCEVVFVACRPTSTYNVIDETAKQNKYKLVKISTSFNVMGKSNMIDGVDLNEVDSEYFRMILDRFADSKIMVTGSEITGE